MKRRSFITSMLAALVVTPAEAAAPETIETPQLAGQGLIDAEQGEWNAAFLAEGQLYGTAYGRFVRVGDAVSFQMIGNLRGVHPVKEGAMLATRIPFYPVEGND